MKSGDQRSNQGVVSLLTQLHKAVNRRTSEELLGMRFKPYMTLGYIRDHPGVTQQELESALFMDANTVVLILNELEAAQFSVRRRDPQDRRRHIVDITDAGRKAIERADKARESLEDEVLSGLSAEERKALRRLLERVLESLVQPAAEART
ncbi:MAG TPA: MarR family winged helix-turn-helix transcriptional regulator [Candidatus Dormibacteraeota bacterium]|nr:MarR family winged helix-turn-helix transcriptional regulator [Candidatus Dormibacteraeota bacterium]